MHGAGNDFVVVDCRASTEPLSARLIGALCDRHRGVGCDQLLTIEPPRSADATLAYGIWNADGSAAGQCGNGARCVAAWARRAGIFTIDEAVMDSPSGPVRTLINAESAVISIELPPPDFDPAAIPLLAPPADSYRAQLDPDDLTFGAVSMGNPHAVIQVADVDQVDVARIGAALQADPRFPDRCNVGFAQVMDRQTIKLRVFERGVGETLACGSGACAAVAVLRRRGELDAGVAVHLPGGTLHIDWPHLGAPIRMAGPTAFVFEGEWHE